jgi:hypothetical protein
MDDEPQNPEAIIEPLREQSARNEEMGFPHPVVHLAAAEAAVREGFAAGRAAASPDERLREALRDANEYLAQIADYSPSEVADAIDSVRAQIKDALAATDSRGKPDGASVPDQSCATCGGSGDRNGNRRAADPFGTCPGCGGTGKVAAADREAPDEETKR